MEVNAIPLVGVGDINRTEPEVIIRAPRIVTLLLYEKKIASLPMCLKELRTMDLDSGLRIRGRYNRRSVLLFVTKSEVGYAAAIYSVKQKGKAALPEKQLLIKEFNSESEVGKLIAQTATRPLSAYSY